MDHQTAADMWALEKYFLNELSASDREAFEEHYFACEVCGDAVRQSAVFLAAAGAPLAAMDTPRHVSPAPTPWWRGSGLLRTAAAVAFASVLGVAGYQRFVEIPRLEGELADTQALRAVPSYFLTISRGEPPVVALSKHDRYVVFTLSQNSERPYPAYRCELQDAAGRMVRAAVLQARGTEPGELEILLPVAGLAEGRYLLAVQGVPTPASSSTAGSPSVARYAFVVERR